MKSSGTGETITETRKLTNIFITIKSCPMFSPNHSSFLPQETIDLLSVTTEQYTFFQNLYIDGIMQCMYLFFFTQSGYCEILSYNCKYPLYILFIFERFSIVSLLFIHSHVDKHCGVFLMVCIFSSKVFCYLFFKF